MASRKNAEHAESVAAASTPAAPVTRQAVAVQVAAALVQSPRFASRITDERQQDLMVALAVSIADKLIQAMTNDEWK